MGSVFPVRRRVRRFRLFALAAVLSLLAGGLGAEELRFFQLGTGPTGEARFPLGGLIANAISNPPGSRECEKGGSCGVPGLVAVAKSTAGSVANIRDVADHRLDAALVDADAAYWAVRGVGVFKDKPVTNLRAIAMVYPQSLHLVVRKDAKLLGIKDLAGKRVAVDDSELGALAPGRLVLAAYGLSDGRTAIRNMNPLAAADALAAGQIDAFLTVEGWPIPAVSELARTTPIALLPLTGPQVDALRTQYPFFTDSEIRADAYEGVTQAVKTLGIGVMLVTSAEEDKDLVTGITRALWHPSTQKLLVNGVHHGRLIGLDADSPPKLGIELHPGAAAYYAKAQLAH